MEEDSFIPLSSAGRVWLMVALILVAVVHASVGFGGEETHYLPLRGQGSEGPALEVKQDHDREGTCNKKPCSRIEKASARSSCRHKARELRIPQGLGEKSALFHPIIVKAATRHEVDPALIKAIIMVESRYNPNAVSRQGAKGLMQLMPKTARALGVEDVFDPEHNVNGGVKYLKQLLNEFNHNLKLALAAYNAGSSKVRRYRGIPPIGATRRYVNRVFEYYRYFKNRSSGKTDDV